MMRSWVRSYAPTPSIAPVLSLVAAVHLAVIGAWIVATLPAEGVPAGSLANRVIYIPPPDKVPGGGMTHEVVHYVTSSLEGVGDGAGPRSMGEARPVMADEGAGRTQRDTALTPTTPATTGYQDSVFTILDVDTAVVRSSSSAAPAYPLKLLQEHVMGSVSARYVVDTTGFADTASFEVVASTHPGFIAAVREALPYMRFQPAKIGATKVRQLVEQQFSFRINDTSATARAKKP